MYKFYTLLNIFVSALDLKEHLYDVPVGYTANFVKMSRLWTASIHWRICLKYNIPIYT